MTPNFALNWARVTHEQLTSHCQLTDDLRWAELAGWVGWVTLTFVYLQSAVAKEPDWRIWIFLLLFVLIVAIMIRIWWFNIQKWLAALLIQALGRHRSRPAQGVALGLPPEALVAIHSIEDLFFEFWLWISRIQYSSRKCVLYTKLDMFLNTPGHPTADRKDHHLLDLKVVWKDIFPNLWTLLQYFLA